MHRFAHIVTVFVITLTLSLKPSPRLIQDETVGNDLEILAGETWKLFLAVFKARSYCFDDVHLHTDKDLDSRAAYDPDTATVTVRVPATVAMLQGALIHEWAHHLEHQCSSHHQMRQAFLDAQGLPVDVSWQTDYGSADIPESEWARIPSEQYAEATIQLVLGERQIPTTALVRREAVNVIAEWASGN